MREIPIRESIDSDLRIFEQKKRDYFIQLGLKVRDAFELHKTAGLWERKDGKRDWGNVSEHCLVEVARADVLAEFLGLPQDIRNDLILAAALHDFNKKQEILGMKDAVSRGVSPTEELYGRIEPEKDIDLERAGFSERVIHIANAAGALPEVLLEVKGILDKGTPTEEDIAFLVEQYVDAYTQGDNWVLPAEGGINDLERRVRSNYAKYGKLEREVIAVRVPKEPLFAERGLSETMGILGYRIEQLFAKLIEKRIGRQIEPLKLPEVIDEEIRKRIIAL